MARIARLTAPGYPHHLTQRGVRSMPIFDAEKDRRTYIKLISAQMDRYGIEILCWCLMPNHVHFIAVPSSTDSLSRGFGEAHRKYTCYKNESAGVSGYFFQGRFYSNVLDERHLIAAARYIERNPVRAGLCADAFEYTWSSARFHSGLSAKDPLVRDRSFRGLIGDWRSFLQHSNNREEELIRRFVRTGRPCGDFDLLSKLEQITGRILTKQKPGPKPILN